jgi:DNA-directed RNA polymerase specialized sigma24 family protein
LPLFGLRRFDAAFLLVFGKKQPNKGGLKAPQSKKSDFLPNSPVISLKPLRRASKRQIRFFATFLVFLKWGCRMPISEPVALHEIEAVSPTQGTIQESEETRHADMALAIGNKLASCHEQFTKLHAAYNRRLMGFLFVQSRRFGGMSPEKMSDLLSEVWARVWRGLCRPESFRGGCFRAWVFRVGFNTLQTWMDRQRRQPELLPPEFEVAGTADEADYAERIASIEQFRASVKGVLGYVGAWTMNRPAVTGRGRPKLEAEFPKALDQLGQAAERVLQVMERITR